MSKKIVISSNNIRNKLSGLFHESLKHIKYSSSGEMDDDMLMWLAAQGLLNYDDDDDDDWSNGYVPDYDIDDADVIWPPKSSKHTKKKGGKNKDAYAKFWEEEETTRKKKHKKSSKKNKARIIDINAPYSGEEEDNVNDFSCMHDFEDDGLIYGKAIYYYPDYHNKDSRLEFDSLKGFNDFCEDSGYNLSEHVANEIMYRRVSHTCLNPEFKEYGLYEIMAEESYGSLFFEVCESSEVDKMN